MLLTVMMLLGAAGAARAEERDADAGAGAGASASPEPVSRTRDAPWRSMIAGPFQSSRLFAMPVADVVGAFQLSLSGDGSLLQETGMLSSAGVLAIGFGDIAQLEYRHTAAISIENTTAPLPSIGVQLEVPLPPHRYLPAWAVALRLGVPRRQTFGETLVDEAVTDLYVVGRLRLLGPLERVTLHGGVRLSSARIVIGGGQDLEAERFLVLPTGGWEVQMTEETRLVGELALAPRFGFDPAQPAPPTIGHGWLGRLGVRWFVLPSLSIDGSLGYQLEVAGAATADGLESLVQWDIRLGGEVFVPWGAIACRTVGIFCE